MTKEEQIELLAVEHYDLWDKWRENLDKRQELMNEMFGDCKFDGGGTVKVHHDKAGWQIYCDSCPASTTFAETFAEAADYWRAMSSAKEGKNLTLEDQMERLVAEGEELWDKYKETVEKQDALTEELFSDCNFCEEGTVSGYCDFEDGWRIHCLKCTASTPWAKTFAEAAEYWRAMNSVAERLNNAKEKESGE